MERLREASLTCVRIRGFLFFQALLHNTRASLFHRQCSSMRSFFFSFFLVRRGTRYCVVALYAGDGYIFGNLHEEKEIAEYCVARDGEFRWLVIIWGGILMCRARGQ